MKIKKRMTPSKKTGVKPPNVSTCFVHSMSQTKASFAPHVTYGHERPSTRLMSNPIMPQSVMNLVLLYLHNIQNHMQSIFYIFLAYD